MAGVTLLSTGGGDIVAVYAAYWAGLPAGEIQVRLHDGAAAYHDEIEIRTTGLPALITRLRGTGIAEGRLAADRPAEPSHYDAIYDLWKRRNSHISIRFVTRAGLRGYCCTCCTVHSVPLDGDQPR